MVLTGIIALLVGLILGVLIGYWNVLRVLLIGTLRVVKSDEERRPYLFLELDKSIDTVNSKNYVLMKVRKEDYISQK